VDLREARHQAMISCDALAALCRDPQVHPSILKSAADRASLAAGRLAGFAHLATS
jgi:hypothetical protein